MSRPVIGLTTYAEEARFGLNDTFAAVLPLSYVHAVHASGGRAVLVTPDDPDTDVLDGLAGIMFTGGSDVGPGLYGRDPRPASPRKPGQGAPALLIMLAAAAPPPPLLALLRGLLVLAVVALGIA